MNKQAEFIGLQLKEIRYKHRINQSQMAEQLGIKRSRLGSYEEGRAMPDIYTFLKICEVYQLSITEFYHGLKQALKEETNG